jgi:uncharacterized membrane protein
MLYILNIDQTIILHYFTNYTLLKKWKPEIVVIDTLWGGVLLAIVTSIIYKLK